MHLLVFPYVYFFRSGYPVGTILIEQPQQVMVPAVDASAAHAMERAGFTMNQRGKAIDYQGYYSECMVHGR